MKFSAIAFSGILVGVWISLFNGAFMVTIGAILIFYLLKYFLPREDCKFVLTLFVVGFLLRMLFVILYYFFYLGQGYPDFIGPDGENYSLNGWYISRVLVEQNPHIPPNYAESSFKTYSDRAASFFINKELPKIRTYQVGVFAYWAGLLYANFGYAPLMLKLINALFSVLTGILVYIIGREAFNSKVGITSMAAFLFFPSVFIFSITSLRDPLIILLLTTIVWLLVVFRKKGKLSLLLLITIASILLEYLSCNIMYPVALLIIVTLFVVVRISFFKKCAFFALSLIVILNGQYINIVIEKYLVTGFYRHISSQSEDGVAYKLFPERIYTKDASTELGAKEALYALVKGIFHFMYEPLPYRIKHGFSFLFGIPESIFLFILTPFVIAGAFIGIRDRFYATVPILFFLLIFLPVMSLSEGNVGTAFRHRDAIMPFLIIFGVAGFCNLISKTGLKRFYRV